MKGEFTFSVHGASVIAEETRDMQLEHNLYMRRSERHTVIRQKANSGNWFHFVIPSPIRLDGHSSYYKHALVKFKLNEDAHIKYIHVHQMGLAVQKIWGDDNLDIHGKDERGWSVDLPHVTCTGGLVISVYVWFVTGHGEVRFYGANATFQERT